MIRDFPSLPLPKYAVARIGCSRGVPDEIAADLREVGVPAGMIGYEYQPLAEATLLDGGGESGLVVFGTSGLFGRLGIDVASRRVVQIPKIAPFSPAGAASYSATIRSLYSAENVRRFGFAAGSSPAAGIGVVLAMLKGSPVSPIQTDPADRVSQSRLSGRGHVSHPESGRWLRGNRRRVPNGTGSS
ncbi:hypothetical protein OG552_31150 [Streptomyces sp. NBC_01476]|uniref:hypothetical protein n=1 Tax=Streptomyces sp. NBC_01476 TaxID=2903881 RepID=UPI002E34DE12|nr:hypothetical protein [Streptomyces sp. NBC_01476]